MCQKIHRRSKSERMKSTLREDQYTIMIILVDNVNMITTDSKR